MSKQTDGRAAYTGAQIGRGNVAVRRHYAPNRITRLRRHCVITRIDENALAVIDALAAKHNETRGEAIGRIVRAARTVAADAAHGCGTFTGKGGVA